MAAKASRVRRAQIIGNELEELAHRVSRFPAAVGRTVDDVEVWLERSSSYGFIFENGRLIPSLSLSRDRVALRVLKDGQMGAASCTRIDEATWQACVAQAVDVARMPGPASFASPRTRKPGPLTFDPDLCDVAAVPAELHRLADAISDNFQHEAERGSGSVVMSGHLKYGVRRYVVGTRGGVAASLHGALTAHVDLDGTYFDTFHAVQAPESYHPLALLGARTLRNMPGENVAPDSAELGELRGRIPVVLHPRVFEALLRRLVVPMLTQSSRRSGLLSFADGDRVAHEGFTLIDDAGLDGLSSSRHFDDEGTPTKRNALIVRGRLSGVLSPRDTTRRAAGTASSYRIPEGAEDPQDAPHRQRAAGLLAERGELSFHEMIGAVPRSILVHGLLGLHTADLARSRFSCGISSGITLERGRESRLLAPGKWSLSGSLFTQPGGSEGLLGDHILSRELYDTGTAILPYCMTYLEVG